MAESEREVVSKDTREIIMEATFRALSKHGYKDLRMRDIGEEMDKTRQVIHYYYDGKYDLMSSFLEYIGEQYEGSVEVDETAHPREELAARIDQCIFGPDFDEFGHWDRMKVYHELFSHARHDERHQAIFNEHYENIRGSVEQVLERGIEEGVFEPVDTERMGQLITDLIHVSRERYISLGHETAPAETREAIDDYILRHIDADES